MTLRAIIGAMLALAVAASPALACTGKEIYSDDFENADGPWAADDWIKIGGGYAELSLPFGVGAMRYLRELPTDFDVCVDITNAAGGAGGIVFGLMVHENTFFLLVTTLAGAVGVVRVDKDKVTVQAPFRTVSAINAGAGAKNTLRITVKGNTATVYVNDQRFAAIEGSLSGQLALYGESADGQTAVWRFSKFRLTEAP